MYRARTSHAFLLLIATGVLVACDRLPPPATPLPPPRQATQAAATPPPDQPQFKNIAWETRAESRPSAAVTGTPVTMDFGKPCAAFRTLPFVEFHRNTLVQDACLEIPSNTTIVVRSGVTLGIVATNGLRIGKHVRFSAKGLQGARGNRADFGTVTFTPDTDAQINAACVDNGNRCACPIGNSSAAALLGHVGGNGTPGGSIRLVMGDLVSPSQLVGLKFDVTGGRGGPPGESGRQNCIRGNTQCASSSCTDGSSSGAQGVAGIRDKQTLTAASHNQQCSVAHVVVAAKATASGELPQRMAPGCSVNHAA